MWPRARPRQTKAHTRRVWRIMVVLVGCNLRDLRNCYTKQNRTELDRADRATTTRLGLADIGATDYTLCKTHIHKQSHRHTHTHKTVSIGSAPQLERCGFLRKSKHPRPSLLILARENSAGPQLISRDWRRLPCPLAPHAEPFQLWNGPRVPSPL